jgi:hypothetical protein
MLPLWPAPTQLEEARDELQLLIRGIESIQKLCELELDDDR